MRTLPMLPVGGGPNDPYFVTAEMIFNAVALEGIQTLADAERYITRAYVLDMSVPRDQICRAVSLLKKHFAEVTA